MEDLKVVFISPAYGYWVIKVNSMEELSEELNKVSVQIIYVNKVENLTSRSHYEALVYGVKDD
jgi:hypothetical protein